MASKLNYYVTTSIAYVNAEPHIGFAMELVQADVLARYFRGQGHNVKFVTGTDEHGTKIHRAAGEAGQPTQQFVDANAAKFQDLSKALNLSNDHFIRTTQAEHKKAAQALWKACSQDIYQSEYEGLYCVGCETFYTDKDLVDGKCSIHKTKPEKIKEKNYFFKLSKYSGQIKDLITHNKLKIVPQTRRNEILALLDRGLEDISISRSKSKLPWGVEVPGDPDQVMYVWFDALSNYISALGYPKEPDFDLFWPANVQVIGKDILRFHAAIWPGMLLSAGIDLPESLYVHGFIQSDGQKMSKSLGNVVDPFAVIDKYGADALRYYLLREIPSYGDGDFSWQRLEAVYNADLANDLGNLVQRTAAMVQKYLGGDLGEIPPHSHDVTEYEKALRDFRFDRALDEVWDLVRGINQYIDEVKPWELAKTDTQHNSEVLHHIVSDILQVSRELLPLLPATAAKIADTFAGGKVNAKVGILFPKLDLADQITRTEV